MEYSLVVNGSEFNLIGGFRWPKKDRECSHVVLGSIRELNRIIGYCSGKKVAVQAGGNVGVWPCHLRTWFGQVVTFEPNEQNYYCLVHNTLGKDIVSFKAALGHIQGWCGVTGDDKNCGAYRIDLKAVTVPMVTVDSLNLPACDLLCLDVEGFELFAVLGSIDTIVEYKPTICFEDKGLSEAYGVKIGYVERMLSGLGYKVADRIKRDVVMVHAG